MIRALLYWVFGSLLTFFLSLTAIVVYNFNGKNSDFPHKVARIWSKIILKVFCGVKLEITGLDNIKRNESYIIVSNHRSYTDIFVASAYIPLQFRWMAKKSLFRLPLVGYAMKVAGYIPVEREKAFRAAKSLDEVKNRLRSGKSIWIFPEGTRTPEKSLGKFKRGAFILAKETDISMLPIVLVNTDGIFEGPLKINPTKVYVNILEPVKFNMYVKNFPDEREALKKMMDDLKEKIQKVYDQYALKFKQ